MENKMDNFKGSEPQPKAKRNWNFNIINFLFGKRKADDDSSFRVILIILTIGFGCMVLISIWSQIVNGKSAWASVLGLSVLVGLAAVISGGFLGFLFGIPRSLQRNTVSPEMANDEGGAERYYSNNTNLEQISDWLTKIIVGVSLTQLPKLQSYFNTICLNISDGFNNYMDPDFSYPLAAGLIIFYAIAGFLAVYLWAKIYLLEQLTKMEDGLSRRKFQKQAEKVSKLEINQLSGLLTDFNRTKNRSLAKESTHRRADWILAAAPGLPQYLQDFQKGRWGRKSVSGPFKLEAEFTKNGITAVEPFTVRVRLVSTDPGTPLIGPVLFFLHDTFDEYIKEIEAFNNIAMYEFGSYEAFTIGVVANNGLLKLELDLNEVVDCPEDYKYSSPLLTVDEVKKDLDELKEEEAKLKKVAK